MENRCDRPGNQTESAGRFAPAAVFSAAKPKSQYEIPAILNRKRNSVFLSRQPLRDQSLSCRDIFMLTIRLRVNTPCISTHHLTPCLRDPQRAINGQVLRQYLRDP